MVDVSTIQSLEEVNRLKRELEKKEVELRRGEISRTRREIEEMLARRGLSLNEVYPRLRASGGKAQDSEAATTSAPASSRAVYRDPATGKTWSGVGRRPKWVLDAINAGRSLAEFRVE